MFASGVFWCERNSVGSVSAGKDSARIAFHVFPCHSISDGRQWLSAALFCTIPPAQDNNHTTQLRPFRRGVLEERCEPSLLRPHGAPFAESQANIPRSRSQHVTAQAPFKEQMRNADPHVLSLRATHSDTLDTLGEHGPNKEKLGIFVSCQAQERLHRTEANVGVEFPTLASALFICPGCNSRPNYSIFSKNAFMLILQICNSESTTLAV